MRALKAVPGAPVGRITYHDGCAGLRELGISAQPRVLLNTMAGVELVEMPDKASCCGFGGLFSVKYPDVSNAIVCKKTAAAVATEADMVVSGELGCLLNIAGKLSREGSSFTCRHIAEVLAGDTSAPPIGHAAPNRVRPAP